MPDDPRVTRKMPDYHEPTTYAMGAAGTEALELHLGLLWWKREAATGVASATVGAPRSAQPLGNARARAIQQRLALQGVPLADLRARAQRLDLTTRGEVEEFHAADTDAMDDLARARAAANRADLGERDA